MVTMFTKSYATIQWICFAADQSNQVLNMTNIPNIKNQPQTFLEV